MSDTKPRNIWQQFADKALRLRSSMLLLENYPELESMVEALRDIDSSEGADKSLLIALLKSSGSKRDELLADLIGRYDLVKSTRKGAHRRPAYIMSDIDLLLAQANSDVDDLRAEGLTIPQAIERAAQARGVTAGQLTEFRAGRRRSLRKR
jgi:hypothetical protein